MPRFEVRILDRTQSFNVPPGDDEPGPEARMVVWGGEAADNDAAIAAAFQVWDAKYGPDKRPTASAIEVKSI